MVDAYKDRKGSSSGSRTSGILFKGCLVFGKLKRKELLGMIPVSAFFLVMVLAISYYLLNSTCVTTVVALRPQTYPFHDRARLFSYKDPALA